MMDAALVSLTSSLHHSTLNSFPTVSTPSTDITFFPEQQVDFIAITPDGEQFQPPAHHHTYSLIESAVKHGSGRENIGSSGESLMRKPA